MHPDDARHALDDIRHRGDQARAAHLRFGHSRTALLLSALALFLPLASYDLPNPWGGAMLLPVVGLLAAMLVGYLCRSPVRRSLTVREAALGAAAGTVLVAAFRGLAAAARTSGVPAPHTAAALVLCVAGVAGLALAGRRWA
ncbi:hypothetical protein [Streptomyces hainanensis]|uniref:Uncharacterized protein n=1 Tax=Streptomyces hainanensis TaxID=402648 RepID=A0A4R4SR87_9ACTN|nr:hypothetical protein [Streptomyces hainanensis]TDC65576.1 hypothetical protein E1283_30520 [Streptomyces hainanensis]